MDQRGHSTKLFPPRAVQSIISAAKNRMMPPAELAAASPFDRLAQVAADVYGAMGPALKAANAMDFDDLLLHPLTLFREHPERLRAYQERFSFILVDEFQDTNKAQYELIRPLGAHGNVFAVGDDDQSIYGWRGADVRNMQDFLQDFAGAKLVRLEENYRSTQIVLDAANGVIAENSGRIGKTLTTRRHGGEAVTLARRGRRARRGRVGGARAPAAERRRRTGVTARWPCSTAPTRSRGRWKKRSAAPACPTG